MVEAQSQRRTKHKHPRNAYRTNGIGAVCVLFTFYCQPPHPNTSHHNIPLHAAPHAILSVYYTRMDEKFPPAEQPAQTGSLSINAFAF